MGGEGQDAWKTGCEQDEAVVVDGFVRDSRAVKAVASTPLQPLVLPPLLPSAPTLPSALVCRWLWPQRPDLCVDDHTAKAVLNICLSFPTPLGFHTQVVMGRETCTFIGDGRTAEAALNIFLIPMSTPPPLPV